MVVVSNHSFENLDNVINFTWWSSLGIISVDNGNDNDNENGSNNIRDNRKKTTATAGETTGAGGDPISMFHERRPRKRVPRL
jgi:hypothetical protein